MSATGNRKRSRLGRVLSAALATAVVASAALLGTLAVGTVLDKWRLAPVLTGSMEPEIPKGSMVMAEPVDVDELRAGDVMLFNAPVGEHPLVVHRIYDVATRGRGPVFHTKGDANDGPDTWTIRVNGSQAWRVRHVAPLAGTAVGVLSNAGARMVVLVLGVVLFTLWGLHALWALRPISWRADDPHGEQRRRRARRASARAAVVATVGLVLVGVVGAMGLAYAQFTATSPPPVPAFTSGSLPTPTNPTCRWANTTSVGLGWTAVAPDFATGYNIQRGNASGGPYASIGTTAILAPTTFTDAAAGPPTIRYYVITSERSTWDSPFSAQLASNACIGAIRLVAGTTNGFSGDTGQATSAQLSAPRGVAVDAAGNVYIADTANNRIRRVDAATGVITTVAGGGASTACTFTGAATAVSLNAPRGVAVDAAGNLYIADTGRNCIRRVTSGTVNQVAGGGASTACAFTGAATAVSLNAPGDVAVDGSGNVYIADTSRNCIRRVTSGTVSQVAGGGASTACTFTGAATAVSLSAPGGVAVDGSGNVYIADTSRNCVRRVTSGTVSRVAGGGASTACTFTGAATAVSLSAPAGVDVDASGRVIVSDGGRRCVRMVSSGAVSQLAGTGVSGSTGDNGPAVGALFTTPTAVATNASGDVWIADAGTHRVRRVEGPL